jgi:hypothetical protein
MEAAAFREIVVLDQKATQLLGVDIRLVQGRDEPEHVL